MTKKKDPSELVRKPVPEHLLKPSSRHNKAYRKRHPQKALAHSRVGEAVKTKRLVKQPCEGCGAETAQAHHPDYSRPLHVVWLCQVCHVTEHYGRPPQPRPVKKFDAIARARTAKKRAEVRAKRKAERDAVRGSAKQLAAATAAAKLQVRIEQRAAKKGEAKRLRAEGLTYAEVGERMGLTRAQVFKIVNEPGYR